MQIPGVETSWLVAGMSRILPHFHFEIETEITAGAVRDGRARRTAGSAGPRREGYIRTRIGITTCGAGSATDAASGAGVGAADNEGMAGSSSARARSKAINTTRLLQWQPARTARPAAAPIE